MKINTLNIVNIAKIANRQRVNISKVLNVPISVSSGSESTLIINIYKNNVLDTVISGNTEINII